MIQNVYLCVCVCFLLYEGIWPWILTAEWFSGCGRITVGMPVLSEFQVVELTNLSLGWGGGGGGGKCTNRQIYLKRSELYYHYYSLSKSSHQNKGSEKK